MQGYFFGIMSKAFDTVIKSNEVSEVGDKIKKMYETSVVDADLNTCESIPKDQENLPKSQYNSIGSTISNINLQHNYLSQSIEGQARQVKNLEDIVKKQTEQIKHIYSVFFKVTEKQKQQVTSMINKTKAQSASKNVSPEKNQA